MVYSYKWEFFPLNKENSRGCVCAYVHAKSFSHIQLFATLWMLLARFLCPLNSTGKNTGVGYHALLQRSFPIQGWTLHFLVSCNGRWVLHLPLVPPGKPFKGKENVFIHVTFLGQTWPCLGFPCGSAGKESALGSRETWVQSLGWGDPLEKGEATHSSFLAWRIPWTI